MAYAKYGQITPDMLAAQAAINELHSGVKMASGSIDYRQAAGCRPLSEVGLSARLDAFDAMVANAIEVASRLDGVADALCGPRTTGEGSCSAPTSIGLLSALDDRLARYNAVLERLAAAVARLEQLAS